MRKILLIVTLINLFNHVQGQQVLAQWNFNTILPPDNNLSTGNLSASMGTGVLRTIGGAATSITNPFNEGSDNDYYTNSLDNTSWNVFNFPPQGVGNKTAGIMAACNTTGYKNIIFRYDERHSVSSPNTTVIQYNPDTSDTKGWIDIQTNKIILSTYSDTWFTRIVDFSNISAVNNKPRFGVRVVAAFDPNAGATYVTTSLQTAQSYAPSIGTIKFDMISFIGTTQNACVTPLTQASNPNIISTNGNKIVFNFQRGTGDSVLILCRESFAVNNFPQTGTVYIANTTFGLGSQVGVGNYVVYASNQPGTNNVTVSGLTPGKEYNFSIFEFTQQHCYKIPPLYFHTTAGGTILNPGELVLTAFDTRVAGLGTGNDKYYLTNLVDLNPGTQFCLTSSRYEAGASPNTRTNRWYNSGDYIYKDMDVQEFTWTGTTVIPAGSVIAIEDKMGSINIYDSVTINGVYEPLVTSDSKKGALNLAALTTKGDQLFLSQGSYYPIGEIYTDRYNLLFGHVLFGMTLYSDWINISSTPSTAFSGTKFRQSRIPPEIECLNISNLTDTVGLGYFKGLRTGTKRILKSGIFNSLNWSWRVGDTLLNLTQQFIPPYSAQVGAPFVINSSLNTDGSWTGSKNTNWFDCSNWEGLYKPSDFTDVIINPGAPNYPFLTSNASCNSLKINTSSSVRVKTGVNLKILNNQ